MFVLLCVMTYATYAKSLWARATQGHNLSYGGHSRANSCSSVVSVAVSLLFTSPLSIWPHLITLEEAVKVVKAA